MEEPLEQEHEILRPRKAVVQAQIDMEKVSTSQHTKIGLDKK